MVQLEKFQSLSRRNVFGFIGLAVLYFLYLFGFGCWWSSIADVENKLEISDGTLGDYYSVAVAGAIIAVVGAPYLQNLFGSRVMALVALSLTSLCFIMFCFVSSVEMFSLFMLLFGFAVVNLDTSVASQGGLLEKATGQRWMGISEVFGGLGGITGSLITGGALLQYASLSVGWAMIIMCIAILTMAIVITPFMYSEEEEATLFADEEQDAWEDGILAALWRGNWQRLWYKPVKTENAREASPILSHKETTINDSPVEELEALSWSHLLLLSSLTSTAFFANSAIGDWSAIYFEENWDITGAEVGILGVVFTFVAEILASLVCDYLRLEVFSTYVVIVAGVVVIALGFALVALVPWTIGTTTVGQVCAALGFSIAGFGVGLLLPVAYSISGSGVRGFSAAETSAVVFSTANIFAFLEPSIMGNISNASGSLTTSFSFVSILATILSIVCVVSPALFDAQDEESRSRRKRLDS